MGLNTKIIGEAAVVDRIKVAFDEYEKEAYKIFQYYAGEMMIEFAMLQKSIPAEQRGAFWTNHTFKAANNWLAKAWQVPGSMGITVANFQDYAERLETDFEMRFASFPYFMDKYEPFILHDLRVLYGEI